MVCLDQRKPDVVVRQVYYRLQNMPVRHNLNAVVWKLTKDTVSFTARLKERVRVVALQKPSVPNVPLRAKRPKVTVRQNAG